MKQCVVAGMGVSVLPSVAVEADVLAGRLVLLPWRGRFEAVTQMVWNNRRAMSPAVGAFLDAARTGRPYRTRTLVYPPIGSPARTICRYGAPAVRAGHQEGKECESLSANS